VSLGAPSAIIIYTLETSSSRYPVAVPAHPAPSVVLWALQTIFVVALLASEVPSQPVVILAFLTLVLGLGAKDAVLVLAGIGCCQQQS